MLAFTVEQIEIENLLLPDYSSYQKIKMPAEWSKLMLEIELV